MTLQVTSRYTPGRSESRYVNKDMCIHSPSSVTHNSQKMETVQTSITGSMKKQNCGLYISQSIIHDTRGWSQKCYAVKAARHKKPVTTYI
jgi:hypothetical protein